MVFREQGDDHLAAARALRPRRQPAGRRPSDAAPGTAGRVRNLGPVFASSAAPVRRHRWAGAANAEGISAPRGPLVAGRVLRSLPSQCQCGWGGGTATPQRRTDPLPDATKAGCGAGLPPYPPACLLLPAPSVPLRRFATPSRPAAGGWRRYCTSAPPNPLHPPNPCIITMCHALPYGVGQAGRTHWPRTSAAPARDKLSQTWPVLGARRGPSGGCSRREAARQRARSGPAERCPQIQGPHRGAAARHLAGCPRTLSAYSGAHDGPPRSHTTLGAAQAALCIIICAVLVRRSIQRNAMVSPVLRLPVPGRQGSP